MGTQVEEWGQVHTCNEEQVSIDSIDCKKELEKKSGIERLARTAVEKSLRY